jgi:hypothetical protein
MVSNTQSHFTFNFASIAVPFKTGGTNVVLALAYQTQLDFYSKFTDIQKNETESSGSAAAITPGVAWRLSPVVSIGATTNIWIGSFDY